MAHVKNIKGGMGSHGMMDYPKMAKKPGMMKYGMMNRGTAKSGMMKYPKFNLSNPKVKVPSMSNKFSNKRKYN